MNYLLKMLNMLKYNINFKLLTEYKKIPNYEHYIINNKGNIINTKTGCILKPHLNTHGYYKVELCKNSIRKTFHIHRLVAELFVPNPNNYNVVNHKDETRTNNDANNLEWCTPKYNQNYGTSLIRMGKAHKKPIIAINEYNKIIADSFKTLSNYLNIKSSASNYVNTGYKCIGYSISYASEDDKNLLNDKELIILKLKEVKIKTS